MSVPVPLLDLGRQYAAVGAEIEAAILEITRSGRFVLGKEVAQFEQDAATLLASKYAIACASGTDALWLAMDAARIKPGDKVISTPFSFFATASAILRCGATPVFADIEADSFNLSAAACETLLEQDPSIRAILPVHLYGQCADWDAFAKLKEKYGVILIEDAAQAFGAAWRGKPAGALGDAAAFSFYPTKNLSAWGDAGLVTASRDSIGDRAQLLHIHGMRQRYFHEEIGWNSRMDTLQAAALGIKLKHITQWNQQRRQVAARYHQLFTTADLPQITLPTADPRGEHVWHQYVIRTPQRDDLRAHLTAEKIGSEIYYPLCLHQQQALAPLGYKTGDFPIAEQAAAEVLALPIFPELREDEQQRVVEAIAAFYK